jgi:hypothetical protein
MFATSSFGEFMREGGWGMWPVLLLGLVTLASAIRYAVRPEPSSLRFVAALWLTLLVRSSASVTDLAAVFRYFEDPGRAPIPDRAHPHRPQKSSARRARGIFLARVAPRHGGIYRERRPLFLLGRGGGTVFCGSLVAAVRQTLMVAPTGLAA